MVCLWCARCAQCAHSKCTQKIQKVCTVCTVCTNVNLFGTSFTKEHTLRTFGVFRHKMVHFFDEHTFGHEIHTKCNKFDLFFFLQKSVHSHFKSVHILPGLYIIMSTLVSAYYHIISHNLKEERPVYRAGSGQRRRAAVRPVPVTSPSPPVSQFKSAARGTVCTLSHNTSITQFERRKGRSAGPAAASAAGPPPGRSQSHHRVRR
jgi:hypothetical protein